jgi:16S rRNA processing protein RimM
MAAPPAGTPRSRAPRPGRTQVRVGRLVKAHGLKGALKLELYTDEPDTRFRPGATFTLQVPDSSPWFGKTVTVREFKWMNSHPVVFLVGVEDREAAESLVRAILWIEADDAATEPDTWYDHQLVGLEVVREGTAVGRVTRVDHMPSQDLLVVAHAGREVLVPFVRALVPVVDPAAGRVVVTPPPGLFEEVADMDDAPLPVSGGASDEVG